MKAHTEAEDDARSIEMRNHEKEPGEKIKMQRNALRIASAKIAAVGFFRDA
jgi:hypothetical protein